MNLDLKKKMKEMAGEIKDLEKELEWMYSREPDEFKYIAHLEARVRELYAKIEILNPSSRTN